MSYSLYGNNNKNIYSQNNYSRINPITGKPQTTYTPSVNYHYLNQKNILIDTDLNKIEIKNDFPNKRIENKVNENITTIYSNQVKQINIQIDNQNTNSKN